VFTVIISNKVGALFTRGLYDRAIRGKQIPILQDWVPEPCKGITAEVMMSTRIVILKRVDTVENIFWALKSGHHAFPVVNAAGNMIGIIPSNFLIILIKNRGYYVNPNLGSTVSIDTAV
jgi:CBS-domain-containing membrane protein